MKTMPSLLAPAGNMRALQTALRFGADAVYCGAKQYGLRAQAGNFDEKQLEQAVTLAHATVRLTSVVAVSLEHILQYAAST